VLLEKELYERATWMLAGLGWAICGPAAHHTACCTRLSGSLYGQSWKRKQVLGCDWEEGGEALAGSLQIALWKIQASCTIGQRAWSGKQNYLAGAARIYSPTSNIGWFCMVAAFTTDRHVGSGALPIHKRVRACMVPNCDRGRQSYGTLRFRMAITEVITTDGSFEAETVTLPAHVEPELGQKLASSILLVRWNTHISMTRANPGFPGATKLRDPDRAGLYLQARCGGRWSLAGNEVIQIPLVDKGIHGRVWVRQCCQKNLDRFEPLAFIARRWTPIVNEVGIRQVSTGHSYIRRWVTLCWSVPDFKN